MKLTIYTFYVINRTEISPELDIFHIVTIFKNDLFSTQKNHSNEHG